LVICGCFEGGIKEFEKQVQGKYEPDTKHGIEYREQIKIMKYLLRKSGVTK